MTVQAPAPTDWHPHAIDTENTAVDLSPGEQYNTPTMLFFGLGFIAIITLISALALEIPELVALGAPSLVLLVLGLMKGNYPNVAVSAELDTPRALEGDLTRLSVTVLSSREIDILEIETGETRGFDPIGSHRHIIALQPRRSRSVTFAIVPLSWGVTELPTFTVRARARGGLFASAMRYRCVTPLRIHINEEPARSQLEPLAFRRVVGSHLSGERNEGCEIADNRPYQPGDRLQSINWRISARNAEPWVTLRHPDRSTSLILVLDAYGSFGEGSGDTLRRTVRAAMGLARLHLDTQDPVGLLFAGHGRRWIEPSLGRAHLANMTDALLELSTQEWAERRDRQRLDRMIPVDSEIIAISPLLNDAFGQLLQPLLARGQHVHVIEPAYELPLKISVPHGEDNGDPLVAWRVFTLEQQLRRRALTDMGAPVFPWSEHETIESILLRIRRSQQARQATVRQVMR